jgi:hypothetical protein
MSFSNEDATNLEGSPALAGFGQITRHSEKAAAERQKWDRERQARLGLVIRLPVERVFATPPK